ncbi:hypothetical protein LJC68_09485 [Bacteroidales bacterium OttesenSCG-928-B11]|nr:hypothetical protein [Bacteroidales bacterium OttesenSCG-928-E04]MDL2309337.1 hypothetical protein [Bacteroidales bacterium OttesenSCG-928-C03]MDL2313094.1 hypothetical protein [Bacteroidales bacterium OttesenSCG-928-B11]MDL2326829.1 hypothetical protein [Bacteroidales bacterium OttesenSCG-928-A14]
MNQQIEDIKIIREMMEKSSKFISLSGISGVLAGVTAIAGAAFAHFYLLRDPALTNYSKMQEMMILLADALVVLTVSLAFGFYFSWRKAKKNNANLFSKMTLRTLYNLAIPLVAGGLFSLIFLLKGNVSMVISGTLIFYGLALVNASKYTFQEIHSLGIIEIILGLLSALLVKNGLLFWTIGFGFCHILYGLIMYFKYDRRKS